MYNHCMPLPLPIAKPIFQIIYQTIRVVTKVKAPSIQRAVTYVNKEQRFAFDRLFDSTLQSEPNTQIDYNLPYPKSDFLNYICDWRGYVTHGSPLHDLDTLQPIRKSSDTSEFGNRQQIFASPDAMWAMWFAILDKEKYKSTNNACIRLGHSDNRTKFYYFALPKKQKRRIPFHRRDDIHQQCNGFPRQKRCSFAISSQRRDRRMGKRKTSHPACTAQSKTRRLSIS